MSAPISERELAAMTSVFNDWGGLNPTDTRRLLEGVRVLRDRLLALEDSFRDDGLMPVNSVDVADDLWYALTAETEVWQAKVSVLGVTG